MSFKEFAAIFLKNSASALAWFTFFVIAAEMLFPGFAAPFLNIPLLAFISFAIFLMYRPNTHINTSLLGSVFSLLPIFAVATIGFLYLLTLRSPLGTIGLIEYISLGIVAFLYFVALLSKPHPYD